MKLNLLPAALEQAKTDAAGQDAVIAGLGRAMLEAADGEAGARFTFRRALAQAEAPAQPGPELRQRVTAAVACGEFAAVESLVGAAFPGLAARLAAAGAGSAALPPDVMPFEMAACGRAVFDLTESMYSSPHLAHSIGRWLGLLPVFAAYAAAGDGRTGRSVLNVGARQRLPGVACNGNRTAAWLVPDPDFLATEGYLRQRRLTLAPDWAARSGGVFWRGAERDRARVQAALAGSGAGLSEDVGTNAAARAGDYRMALDLDGGLASSAVLFQLLLGGAPVLRAAAADGSRMWLDSRLVAWTHYVPVAADLSDLAERVGWLLAHEDEARAIGAAGRAFAREVDFRAELKAAAQAVGAALHTV